MCIIVKLEKLRIAHGSGSGHSFEWEAVYSHGKLKDNRNEVWKRIKSLILSLCSLNYLLGSQVELLNRQTHIGVGR